MKSLICITNSAFYTHNYVFHMSDGVLLESFLPFLPRRHTDVPHMSCKLPNDDFAAFKNKKTSFLPLQLYTNTYISSPLCLIFSPPLIICSFIPSGQTMKYQTDADIWPRHVDICSVCAPSVSGDVVMIYCCVN